MRTLLALFVGVAVFLVFAKSHLIPWHNERRQIRSVLNAGGDVFEEPLENLVAYQLLGESISNRAVSVFLRNPNVTDEWLQNVSDLKHCRVLGIQSKNVSDHAARPPHSRDFLLETCRFSVGA